MKVMLDEGAYMIERAYDTDAGYDIRTPRRVVVHRNDSVVIDTGVHILIDEGMFGKIESKSGLNTNHSVVSHGGVVDSWYTGSIRVKMYNHGGKDYIFEKGDKIVQIIFHRYEAPEFELVNELEETKRGNNGFGSSGR